VRRAPRYVISLAGACLTVTMLLTAAAADAQIVAPIRVGEPNVLPAAGAPSGDPPATGSSLGNGLRRLARDQRSIWTFPAAAVRGSHWKITVPVVAVTAVLAALDSHDTPYFRRTDRFGSFNDVLSGRNTGLAEVLLPAAFGLAGWATHGPHARDTGLRAAEALLDAEVVAEVSKNVSRRLRPSDIQPGGDFGRTWFRAGDGLFTTTGSFPSAHTAGAFAVASVVSARYRDHRWVSWVAYGAAALVGVSRVTLQSHFPADVFVGGALGIGVGRLVEGRPSAGP
jgi:membrane-associated phospholipid phosphatase